MEKSRLYRAEQTQISEQYEPMSGYNFGVDIKQGYDISMDFLNFDIDKEETLLRELFQERENLERANQLKIVKQQYDEKASHLSESERAKLALYEQLGLQIAEKLPQESKDKSLLNMYKNYIEKMDGQKFNMAEPMKRVSTEQEKQRPNRTERNKNNRDDWDMER